MGSSFPLRGFSVADYIKYLSYLLFLTTVNALLSLPGAYLIFDLLDGGTK